MTVSDLPARLNQTFWRRVVKTNGCWLWRGVLDRAGYGRVHWRVDGRFSGSAAHRVAYMLMHGDIPDGMIVRHACDNPTCVNPDHLSIGTHRENVLDREVRGRHAHRATRPREATSSTLLTDQDVIAMRCRYAAGNTNYGVLATEYHLSVETIVLAIHGRSRPHLPDVFEKPTGLDDRFWSKVNKQGPEHPALGRCWDWTAGKTRSGYGHFSIGGREGRQHYAHRLSYEAACGPIPTGLYIDHLCRRPCCVNPDHLEPVTPAENIRRGVPYANYSLRSKQNQNSVKTHCIHGHAFTEENTNRNGGGRHCRTCQRDNARRRNKRRVKGTGPLKGEANNLAKLTERDVLEIRARHRAGISSPALAVEFDVDRGTIWLIVSRKTWTHLPDEAP